MRCVAILLAAVMWLAGDANAACLSERAEVERHAHIEVAIEKRCAGFPSYVQSDPVLEISKRLQGADRSCLDEVRLVYQRVREGIGAAGFCRLAEQIRNSGIGAPGTPAIADLIGILKKVLEPSERIIGLWVDATHPCGMVSITQTGSRLRHVSVCSDGGTDRRYAVDGSSDLIAIKPPRGAKRAWRTPEAVGVGDRETFVELNDGTLLEFQAGVGLNENKAVIRASPMRWE